MSDRYVPTGKGCLLVLLGLGLYVLMMPGGLWIFTFGHLLPWRLNVAVGFAVVGVEMILDAWSLGWVHSRGFLWKRPPWILHPITRTTLIFLSCTFVAALPFSMLSDKSLGAMGVFAAPVVGAFAALLWLAIVTRDR